MSDWKQPFFSVWTGQQCSLIGSQVAQFALVWWVTETTGSAAVLASATAVAMLPGILISPFAGALVVRWSRRTIMIVADGLIALVAGWVVVLFWTDSIQVWHVYVLMTAHIDVATALLAILPLLVIAIPQPERIDDAGQGMEFVRSIWQDRLEGLRYIGAWPGLCGLLAIMLVPSTAHVGEERVIAEA